MVYAEVALNLVTNVHPVHEVLRMLVLGETVKISLWLLPKTTPDYCGPKVFLQGLLCPLMRISGQRLF